MRCSPKHYFASSYLIKKKLEISQKNLLSISYHNFIGFLFSLNRRFRHLVHVEYIAIGFLLRFPTFFHRWVSKFYQVKLCYVINIYNNLVFTEIIMYYLKFKIIWPNFYLDLLMLICSNNLQLQNKVTMIDPSSLPLLILGPEIVIVILFLLHNYKTINQTRDNFG